MQFCLGKKHKEVIGLAWILLSACRFIMLSLSLSLSIPPLSLSSPLPPPPHPSLPKNSMDDELQACLISS